MNAAPDGTAARLEDLSWRARFGCKGPGAPEWLGSQGYLVPGTANSAVLDGDGVLVARLGLSEFLIEAVAGASKRVAASREQLGQGSTPRSSPASVYPVPRQDLAIGLCGVGLHALLRQTCSVDFEPVFAAAAAAAAGATAAAASEAGPVFLTSMLGVGVLAWPRHSANGPTLTLWSDPSFAHYFWHTLLEVGAVPVSVADAGEASTGFA